MRYIVTVNSSKYPQGFWVFLGGGSGATLRWVLGAVVPASSLWVTWGINMLGAFCLGLLLSYLSTSGPDQGARQTLRLGLGTGFLGGFTTYSAFAVQSVQAWASAPASFGVYLCATVILGVCACWVGSELGTRLGRRHPLISREAGD